MNTHVVIDMSGWRGTRGRSKATRLSSSSRLCTVLLLVAWVWWWYDTLGLWVSFLGLSSRVIARASGATVGTCEWYIELAVPSVGTRENALASSPSTYGTEATKHKEEHSTDDRYVVALV